MKKNDILEKLANIKPSTIYALAFIIFIIPFLHPLGIPFQVSSNTYQMYNLIDNIPTGSIVAFAVDSSPSAYPDIVPGSAAVINHMWRKNLKIVFFTTYTAEAPQFFESYIEISQIPDNKKYGEDYVYLGYIPGGETAATVLAKNLHVGVKDRYGNLLSELPLMQNIHTADDITLLYADGLTPTVWYIRQWVIPYKVDFAITAYAVNVPSYLPYYQSGLIKGMLIGAIGGAEYEKLIGVPGIGYMSTDVHSMAALFTVSLIILGNVVFVLRKKK